MRCLLPKNKNLYLTSKTHIKKSSVLGHAWNLITTGVGTWRSLGPKSVRGRWHLSHSTQDWLLFLTWIHTWICRNICTCISWTLIHMCTHIFLTESLLQPRVCYYSHFADEETGRHRLNTKAQTQASNTKYKSQQLFKMWDCCVHFSNHFIMTMHTS